MPRVGAGGCRIAMQNISRAIPLIYTFAPDGPDFAMVDPGGAATRPVA